MSRNLSVDTNNDSSFQDLGLPQLTLSTTASTNDEPSPLPLSTPTNQPIKNMSPEEREQKAKAFVAKLRMKWEKLGEKQIERVKLLMSEDCTWSPTRGNLTRGEATTFGTEFNEFCNALGPERDGEAWRDCSRLFFDQAAVDKFMVIRRQRTDTCCLHAAVVFQHYLQCLETETQNHEMLDISGFLRDHLDEGKQKQFIKSGACGLNAREFFGTITGKLEYFYALRDYNIVRKSVDEAAFRIDVDMILEQYQKLNEPALVAKVQLEKNFHTNVVLDGEVDVEKLREYAKSKKKGAIITHAMVMLGVYKDEATGKVWFLLQNFSKNGYFRLASAEYMASTSAHFCFRKHKKVDVSLKPGLGIMDAEYAETDFDIPEEEIWDPGETE